MDIFCKNNNHGYLEIVLGPMFSGKTTNLIEIYQECCEKNINVSAINYMFDKRYSNTMISSHDNKKSHVLLLQTLKILHYKKRIL